MRRILLETGSESYKAYIGGEDNFRYQIYPEYKANRKDLRKPEWLQDVRAYLVSEWNAEIVNGMEADDALGIEQHKHFFGESIVCSIDKDLLQLPGKHYNFVRQEFIDIEPITGLHNFYQQLLQGDQSDNIPGYDGKMRPIIPKFLQPVIHALRARTDEDEMYDLIEEMYDDAGNLDTLERNAQLLWILREEGKFWSSPSR